MTELPVSPPPARPLEASLDQLTRALGIPNAAALETVFSRWTELVGPAVAAHARPASMRDGVLLVNVDEPAWGTELRYRAQELLTRIGHELGPGTPTRIEVRVRPEMPGQGAPSVINFTHRNSAP
jgi:predicted nucleic acid-binding Zn ribbon protein